MTDTLKEVTINQYEAAFCTLGICIDRCPDGLWHEPVASLEFCQVAFHTLFFADYYLGESPDALREQPFHRDNADFFRDYEELEPRRQVLRYERCDINRYLAHCREKAERVVGDESAEDLASPATPFQRPFSRAELHVYNIRHIQHHSAQLILRLRLESDVDVPWVGSGWNEGFVAAP